MQHADSATMATRRLLHSKRLLFATLAIFALMAGGHGYSGVSAAQPGATAVSATPHVLTSTPISEAANTCDSIAPDAHSEAWTQTELYFGTTKPNGMELTDEEFNTFVDNEITPRFPDGLTVLTGYGQWRNSKGEATSEKSVVVIILAPNDPTGKTSAKIEEIRTAYKTQFDQESVLRTDTPGVCVSF
ncbi:MAG: DUF3574 domain-containing protein [Thermomicrobiales bacterium]